MESTLISLLKNLPACVNYEMRFSFLFYCFLKIILNSETLRKKTCLINSILRVSVKNLQNQVKENNASTLSFSLSVFRGES